MQSALYLHRLFNIGPLCSSGGELTVDCEFGSVLVNKIESSTTNVNLQSGTIENRTYRLSHASSCVQILLFSLDDSIGRINDKLFGLYMFRTFSYYWIIYRGVFSKTINFSYIILLPLKIRRRFRLAMELLKGHTCKLYSTVGTCWT